MSTAPLVLVVDDQPDNLFMYTRYLEAHGKLRLLTAMNGTEALLKAKRFRPDIIVMDIAMPQMDGFQVTAALAAGTETKEIPIILLSAYASAAEAQKRGSGQIASFVGGPVAGYASKPCAPDTLLRHVERVLAERRAAV